MMRALFVMLVLLMPARVLAAPTAAELLQKGLRSYAVGEYDDAIAAFKQGYELEPRADFLYALGQAQRMQGDCRAAAASYRAYLRTAPPERSARPARENLKRCETQLATAPPQTSPPPATVTTPSPQVQVQAAPPPREHRRWWRDPAGDALAGIGVAALIAGGASWGVGESGARALAGATQYGQLAARLGQADGYERERTAGIVVVAVGGALVVSGVVRWLVVSRRR